VEFQKKICGWMKEENKACLFADSIEDYTLWKRWYTWVFVHVVPTKA
jgi:hypothetical protein